MFESGLQVSGNLGPFHEIHRSLKKIGSNLTQKNSSGLLALIFAALHHRDFWSGHFILSLFIPLGLFHLFRISSLFSRSACNVIRGSPFMYTCLHFFWIFSCFLVHVLPLWDVFRRIFTCLRWHHRFRKNFGIKCPSFGDRLCSYFKPLLKLVPSVTTLRKLRHVPSTSWFSGVDMQRRPQ